jgi:hypothetical protein
LSSKIGDFRDHERAKLSRTTSACFVETTAGRAKLSRAHGDGVAVNGPFQSHPLPADQLPRVGLNGAVHGAKRRELGRSALSRCAVPGRRTT